MCASDTAILTKMTYFETNILKNITLYSLYPFALLKTRPYLSKTVGDKNILGTKISERPRTRVFNNFTLYWRMCRMAIEVLIY